MLKRLRTRIEALKRLGKSRLELLSDDVNGLSNRTSTLVDENLEELLSKPTRDINNNEPIDTAVSHMAAKGLQTYNINNGKALLKKTSTAKIISNYNQRRKVLLRDIKQKLQLVSGSFLDRRIEDVNFSVNNVTNLAFDDMDWPISIKWPDYNRKSECFTNGDGQMRLDSIVRYSIDTCNCLESRKVLFKLRKYEAFQNYLVILFWYIKCKLFQSNFDFGFETLMISLLTKEYLKLFQLCGEITLDIHAKDHLFSCLPVVLANAVFFGYYFLFPGSIHIFIKALHQTIYLQIVKLMFGTQLSPSSVDIIWERLVNVAETSDCRDVGTVYATLTESLADLVLQIPLDTHALIQPKSRETAGPKSCSLVQPELHITPTIYELGVDDDGDDADQFESDPAYASDCTQENMTQLHNSNHRGTLCSDEPGATSFGASSTKAVDDVPILNKLNRHEHTQSLPNLSKACVANKLLRTSLSRTLSLTDTYNTETNMHHTTAGTKRLCRQTKVMRNMREVSPLIQQHLQVNASSLNSRSHQSKQHESGRQPELLAVTEPVSWCAVGGVSTYHKEIVSKQTIDQLGTRMSESRQLMKETSRQFSKERVLALKTMEKLRRHKLKQEAKLKRLGESLALGIQPLTSPTAISALPMVNTTPGSSSLLQRLATPTNSSRRFVMANHMSQIYSGRRSGSSNGSRKKHTIQPWSDEEMKAFLTEMTRKEDNELYIDDDDDDYENEHL